MAADIDHAGSRSGTTCRIPDRTLEAASGAPGADLLQAEGATVLVHPSGLHWGDRRVKNDYRDGKELLDRMRLHKLPESWIAPPPVRELRELVRYRAKLVALRTGLKPRSRRCWPSTVCTSRSRTFGAWPAPPTSTTWNLDDGYHTKVESLRDLVEMFDREVAMLEREISRWLRDDRGYRPFRPSTVWAQCQGPSSWPRSATSAVSRLPTRCARGRG